MKICWIDVVIKTTSYIFLIAILILITGFIPTFGWESISPVHIYDLDLYQSIVGYGLVSLVILWFRRGFQISIIVIGMIPVFHVLATELSRILVHFIGWYITDSYANKDYNTYIVWDWALQGATYLIYATVFFTEGVCFHKILKSRDTTKALKVTFIGMFILSFPSATTWYIAYTCGGWGGDCQRDLTVITPLVMSNDPVYISISLVLALIVLLYYVKINNIS